MKFFRKISFISNYFSFYIKSKEDLYKLLKFFFILGCVAGFFTFCSKFYTYVYEIDILEGVRLAFNFGGDSTVAKERIRASGFAPYGKVAFALNFFIFVTLSFVFWAKKSREKIFYTFVLSFLIITLILTGSKSGFGSFMVGISLALLFNPFIKHKRIRWTSIIAFLIIFGFIFVYVSFKGEGRIVKSVAGGEMATSSATSRLEIWKIGIKEYCGTYGLGFGVGTSASYAAEGNLPHMHNFFLSALFDLGIFGFALFVIIILRVLHELYKQIMYNQSKYIKNILSCLFGSFITAMIQGLTISEFDFTFFWIIIGVIVAITTKANLMVNHEQEVPKQDVEALPV